MEKSKAKKVDDMGIRLAPTPMRGNDVNQLPSVRQDFVLRPSLEIDEPQDVSQDYSTVDDFQPKAKDVGKTWKRRKRGKNFICGLLMLLTEAIVVLPYLFAVFGVKIDFLPFKYVLDDYNAIGHIVDFATNGGKFALIVPDLILAVGLLFILVNIVKSLTGICGAVKVRKYATCSVLYFIFVAILFVIALVGADSLGVGKIDFMQDVIHGYATSEWFTLFATAVFGIIMSVICSFINPDKSGYTR